jgi:hypothetical protein
VEGEKPAKSTLDGGNNWYSAINREKLSGGDLIRHGHGSKPSEAECVIEAAEAGEYEYWVRADPTTRSSLWCQLNDGDRREVDVDKAVGSGSIADDDAIDFRCIAWMKVGQVELKAGASVNGFRFDRNDDAPDVVRRHGYFDCFVLSHEPLEPQGTFKPDQKSQEVRRYSGGFTREAQKPDRTFVVPFVKNRGPRESGTYPVSLEPARGPSYAKSLNLHHVWLLFLGPRGACRRTNGESRKWLI